MLAKYLTIGLALMALAAKGRAQGLTAPAPSGLLLTPSQDITTSAKNSPPLFLRSIQETKPVRSGQSVVASPMKECPMPVHRPDISRLERMPVAQPSPNVTYSMSRVELKCPNPLDLAK